MEKPKYVHGVIVRVVEERKYELRLTNFDGSANLSSTWWGVFTTYESMYKYWLEVVEEAVEDYKTWLNRRETLAEEIRVMREVVEEITAEWLKHVFTLRLLARMAAHGGRPMYFTHGVKNGIYYVVVYFSNDVDIEPVIEQGINTLKP